MAKAPFVFARSKSAYRGADTGKVRAQLEQLRHWYNEFGPSEFAEKFFWILRKNPEAGETQIAQASEHWNKRLIPFKHNAIQKDIHSRLTNRNIFLKPRQGGYTTWMIIMRLLLPAILEPGVGCLLISQNNTYATAHFSMLHRAFRWFAFCDPFNIHAPSNWWAMEAHKHLLHVTYSSRRELIFDALDSRIVCASAEVEEVGQGLCLSPKTWTQTADNRYLRFKDVKVGDWVIGSTGRPVHVTKTFIIPAHKHPYKGEARRLYIRALGDGSAITCAPNHPFRTDRGMLEAKDIMPGDYFAYPRRQLTEELKEIPLPKRKGRVSSHGVLHVVNSKARKQASAYVLDRDLGFACGWYLADGSWAPRFVQYTMINKRKIDYGRERLLAKLQELVAWPKIDRKRNRVIAAGVVFANFIKEHFGSALGKHVPEWWYKAPKAFLVGLLEGWLVGDGWWKERSITGYGSNPAIVLPMKEIAIALGVGFPYMRYKNGRRHKVIICGTKAMSCGKKFQLFFAGIAHENLAKLIGLPTTVKNGHLRRKSQYQDDSYVYIKIDRVAKTRVKEFRDITVDSPDHLYCLPYVLTHNTIQHLGCTEVARWEHNPEETLANVKESVPIDGTIDLESTANMMGGYFYEECMRARNGKSEYTFHFHPWYFHEEYRIPDKPAKSETLTGEEKALVKGGLVQYKIAIDLGQIAWRRFKKLSLRHNFAEKYPEDEISCFLLQGNNYFDNEILINRKREVEGEIPLARYKFFAQYKKPQPHKQYIIGVDPATGRDASQGNLDWCAALVLEKETGEQVASYHAKKPPEDVAVDMAQLGRMYNNALIAVERTGDGGTVMLMLQIANQYTNIYKHREWWKRDWGQKLTSASKGSGGQKMKDIEGFPTSPKTRPVALTRVAIFIRESPELIHDLTFINECLTFVRDETGKPAAAEGSHDDMVSAMWIANYVRLVVLGYLELLAIPASYKDESEDDVELEEDDGAENTP